MYEFAVVTFLLANPMLLRILIFAQLFRLRISMDRISDSDSEDVGSIPTGATASAEALAKADKAFLFCFKASVDE